MTNALCTQVMAPNRKIYALKRIKLQGRDKEAAAGFIDEINLLQRLRGKMNIIQLLDAEVGALSLRPDVPLLSLIFMHSFGHAGQDEWFGLALPRCCPCV